ncbi:MAG: thiamine phosphate synthase [Candidatus Krumholzibacteriota bacterium]|nr:thiamine phosphate synthase [Candidatus Krumholzibacteriota bacterium]
MAELQEKEKKTLIRILDANGNRCAEGLRVIEEIARLGMNNARLAGEIKSLRHNVRLSVSCLLDNSVRCRDSEGDVGRKVSSAAELTRRSFESVLKANFFRAEESLRVIEEFSKLIKPESGVEFKEFRFRVYSLEKSFLSKVERSAVIPKSPFLYAIIDRSLVPAPKIKETAAALCSEGADIIQYRAKDFTQEEKFADLSVILFETCNYDIPVIVNDDPYLAAECGADGVHLGSSDPDPAEAREILGPGSIIGLTIHSIEEMKAGALGLVNYVAVGSIFSSATKRDVFVKGTKLISKVKEITDLPLVAIGGISPENTESVFDSGADGIAVISSLLKGDIAKNCFTFRQIIDKR